MSHSSLDRGFNVDYEALCVANYLCRLSNYLALADATVSFSTHTHTSRHGRKNCFLSPNGKTFSFVLVELSRWWEKWEKIRSVLLNVTFSFYYHWYDGAIRRMKTRPMVRESRKFLWNHQRPFSCSSGLLIKFKIVDKKKKVALASASRLRCSFDRKSSFRRSCVWLGTVNGIKWRVVGKRGQQWTTFDAVERL